MAVSDGNACRTSRSSSFHRDGFLIIEEGFLSERAIEALRERFDALFAGEYATGIQPDEVNWKRGRDPEDLTRQICNGWRADDLIAAQVLSERTGRLAAQLMGYRGDAACSRTTASGSRPARARWACTRTARSPTTSCRPEMITCWVALDDTRAEGGTIEYARGSHRWPKVPPDRGSFHAPEDWLAPVRAAAPDGVEPELRAGGGQGGRLHVPPLAHLPRLGPQRGHDATGARSSRTWSPAQTRFHPTNVDQSTRATAAAATSRWTSRSSRCSGRRPAARSAWLSELPDLP